MISGSSEVVYSLPTPVPIACCFTSRDPRFRRCQLRMWVLLIRQTMVLDKPPTGLAGVLPLQREIIQHLQAQRKA
jgi:hypothetical protein